MSRLEQIDILTHPQSSPTVSPLGDLGSDTWIFRDTGGYRKLLSQRFMTPERVNRKGMLQEFFRRSALLKLREDIARGYDISLIPFVESPRLAGWGVVTDRPGRVFSISETDERIEIRYQAGVYATVDEWRRNVAILPPDNTFAVRRFFSGLRAIVAGRVMTAAALTFGIWDAFWTAFGWDNAWKILRETPDAAQEILDYWTLQRTHTVEALLETGVKIIFLKEHGDGFPAVDGRSTLSVSLVERMRRITDPVREAGALIFLDCDANAPVCADFAERCGFSGIGPMVFSTVSELEEARRLLSGDLILIGSTAPGRDQSSDSVCSTAMEDGVTCGVEEDLPQSDAPPAYEVQLCSL